MLEENFILLFDKWDDLPRQLISCSSTCPIYKIDNIFGEIILNDCMNRPGEIQPPRAKISTDQNVKMLIVKFIQI